jgi:hypothetical protein
VAAGTGRHRQPGSVEPLSDTGRGSAFATGKLGPLMEIGAMTAQQPLSSASATDLAP